MVMAVDYFQRAIDQDTRYALPYVGMADVFNMLAEFGFIAPQDAYLKSRSLLQKAQEIDDSLSELYASLALIWLGMVYLDKPAVPEKAIEYLQKAIDLGVTNAYGYLGMAQALAGRKEEAWKCLKKLERIKKEPSALCPPSDPPLLAPPRYLLLKARAGLQLGECFPG